MDIRQGEAGKEADLQVIFGTGPVGCAAARHLLEEGLPVRMVNRSGKRPAGLLDDLAPELQARLEFSAVDAMNAQAVRAASRGATHIYHCANVSYELWKRDLPVLHANLVSAAIAHGAVLAVAENLYMFARALPVINEDSPVDPPSRKGRIVQTLHRELEQSGQGEGAFLGFRPGFGLLRAGRAPPERVRDGAFPRSALLRQAPGGDR